MRRDTLALIVAALALCLVVYSCLNAAGERSAMAPSAREVRSPSEAYPPAPARQTEASGPERPLPPPNPPGGKRNHP
jgi:hypothetical protein